MWPISASASTVAGSILWSTKVSRSAASTLGAVIASCMLIPKSTKLEMTCGMRQMILRPPGAPTVRKGLPSLSSSNGAMLCIARLYPAIELARAGHRVEDDHPVRE